MMAGGQMPCSVPLGSSVQAARQDLRTFRPHVSSETHLGRKVSREPTALASGSLSFEIPPSKGTSESDSFPFLHVRREVTLRCALSALCQKCESMEGHAECHAHTWYPRLQGRNPIPEIQMSRLQSHSTLL